jgi:hypothetical protein
LFLCFFLTQIREQEGGIGPAYGRSWCQWDGRGGRERMKECEHGANTVYTMNVSGKMMLLKLFHEWGDKGIKENGREDEFKNDVFDIL